MDAASQYRVIFSGHTRSGFDPAEVRDSLGRKLRLSDEQAQRLFNSNAKLTLKRTDSKEEAQRLVMQLARLGAVATIEPGTQPEKPAAPAGKTGAKAASPKKSRAAKTPTLPAYSPRPRNLMYKPLLLLSASLEVLLTLLYALLLLALGVGVFYFSLFTLWAANLTGNPLLALPLQLLGLVVGFVLLVLLAKPLLSLLNIRHRGVTLSPENEMDIHLFVEDICQRFALPMPEEIRLSNDLAVRLQHHRGPAGFWRGQSVLIIGAPLLAGITSSQLAAAIAHAIYCFRPPHAPRSGFLIMSSNRWLHQAVHGEDILDRSLRQWQQEGRLSAAPVEALQRLFAYSRRLMRLRQAISLRLERRLVHRIIAEADKRAVALAGSEGFRYLLEQRLQLHHTVAQLEPELKQQWYESGELPQDVIQLILQRLRRYPAGMQKQLRLAQEQEKAASGDIIPSDAQRIRSIGKQLRAPGYDCLSPASTLLHYFAKLALTMSLRFYHNRLQLPITPDKLTRLVPKGSTEELQNRTIDRFFNGLWLPRLPLKLGLSLQGIQSDADAAERWQKAGKQIQRDLNHAQHEQRQLRETEEHLLDDGVREVMYQAEMWRALGEDKPRRNELELFYEQCRSSENHYEESLQKLRQQLQPYAQRLGAALAVLKFKAKQGNALVLFREAAGLIEVYDRIDAVQPTLRELQQHTSLLQVLLSYRGEKHQAKLSDRIDEQASDIRQALTSIRVAFKDVANPYPPKHGSPLLMDCLLRDAYTEETPEGDFDRGNDVLQHLTALQKRILSRLITLATQVEKQLM